MSNELAVTSQSGASKQKLTLSIGMKTPVANNVTSLVNAGFYTPFSMISEQRNLLFCLGEGGRGGGGRGGAALIVLDC